MDEYGDDVGFNNYEFQDNSFEPQMPAGMNNWGDAIPQDDYGYNPWSDEAAMDFSSYGQSMPGGGLTGSFLDQYQQGPSMSGPMSAPVGASSMPMLPQENPMGGTEDVLAKIFANPSLLAKGLGALFEGQQNKKMGSSMNKIAERPVFDPFGSQRPYYQQQLQNTVQDPYNQPIVKAQADQLARAQRIIDAKAGRRSNTATSAPGVLAAQAAIAQKYMESLQTPAGANIRPDSGSLAQLLGQGAKYDTQGSISPLLNVLGNYTRNQDNQAQMEQLAKILKGQ